MSALKSTALLTAVGLFGQAVGFVYRVGLSRAVGSEVMGLYQLVMPAMSVILSLTAVGFTVACSHLTAQYRATGNHLAARQALRQCLLGFFCAFGLVAGVAAPLSDAISVHLLGDARARLGLLLVLPCVLLTGIENIHKHAFYGAGRVTPPALTEIAEQLIRTGAVLGLLWHFLPQNPERTVGLVLCGMILCEVFSALTLTLLYRRFWGRETGGDGVERGALWEKLGRIALPIAATSLLGNLMGAWTAVLIPQRLVRSGSEVSAALRALGVLQGMTIPLLSLPNAVISALGLVLLPKLSQAAALGRRELCRHRVDRALGGAAALLFPACALLCVLCPYLGRALFKDSAVGGYALPLSLAIALGGLESVLAVCLNGLGRQSQGARNGLVCGAVQLGLTWWRMALPGVGLRGYVEALLLSTLLGLWLNWRSVSRALDMTPRLFAWLVAPLLSALLSGLCGNLLLPILLRAGVGLVSACIATAAFAALLYLSAMAAQGVHPLPRQRSSAAKGSPPKGSLQKRA